MAAAGGAAPNAGPLLILAGGGRFPVLVAEAAEAVGRRVVIAGIRGEADAAIEAHEHLWIGRGHLGRLVRAGRRCGARELVIIGHMRQRRMPRLSEFDIGDLLQLVRHWRLLSRGDDGVLRRIARLLEANGLTVVGADRVAPHLVVPAGPLGAVVPDAAALADVRVGLEAARDLGRGDLGQGVVVRDGTVVVSEGRSGTDAMIAAYGALADRTRGRGGVLVKCPKPIQDLRLDMPAIGPDTVRAAIAAGLAGIAVEAGGTLVADRDETVRLADAAGVFVHGFETEPAGGPR